MNAFIFEDPSKREWDSLSPQQLPVAPHPPTPAEPHAPRRQSDWTVVRERVFFFMGCICALLSILCGSKDAAFLKLKPVFCYGLQALSW